MVSSKRHHRDKVMSGKHFSRFVGRPNPWQNEEVIGTTVENPMYEEEFNDEIVFENIYYI